MNTLIDFPAAPTISVSWRYVVQLWTLQIKLKTRTEMKKVHLAIMQIPLDVGRMLCLLPANENALLDVRKCLRDLHFSQLNID